MQEPIWFVSMSHI